MWLDDLALYARALDIQGLGPEVYIYDLPFEGQVKALLVPPFQGIQIDKEWPEYYKGTFQLTVRGATGTICENIANILAPALHCDEEVRGGTLFRYIHQRYLPVTYPQTAGGYFESNTAFDICFQPILG